MTHRLQIQWIFKGRRRKALLNQFDKNMNIVLVSRISVKVAEALIANGMGSGS